MSYSRFEAMELLGKRLTDDALVILSLGGAVDEWYNAAPHMREASLFQQQTDLMHAQLAALQKQMDALGGEQQPLRAFEA